MVFSFPIDYFIEQQKWMEMKQIELKELIREVLLTEFQGDKEIESQINAYGKLKDKKIKLSF